MNREELRQEVISQRIAQGLDPEPSEEQLAFVGAVIASDRRASTPPPDDDSAA